MTEANRVRLQEVFAALGQVHVFQYFDRLSPQGQTDLLAQAASIDWEVVQPLTTTLVKRSQADGSHTESIKPAPYIALPEKGGHPAQWAEAVSLGEKTLRAWKVAAFMAAGGQGTRLGFNGLKGAFPITPVRKKSLFQVFAEKIRAAQRRYSCRIAWLIMTSPLNHKETVAFFKKHDYFCLDPQGVFFFSQVALPIFDFEGNLILEQPGVIAMGPDGHGGAFRALVNSGVLPSLRDNGVELLSYFQIDNPLARCIDSAFIGFHVAAGSTFSSKMVPRISPEEKVGLFVLHNGHLEVREYSDMPLEYKEKQDASGHLYYSAGNTGQHILSCDFALRVGNENLLPFHRAEKKVTTLDQHGNPVTPQRPNGIKFEQFLFDALPLARSAIVVEASREDEFSPVKNAIASASPQTCREDQLKQYYRWAAAAGLSLAVDVQGCPTICFEVSPLFATDAATFVSRWHQLAAPHSIRDGLYLE